MRQSNVFSKIIIMKLIDFDYPFPKELIAKYPLEYRDSSRLLVVRRKTGSFKEEKFTDLLNYITEGDVVILNDTKVKRSRLFGKKTTGGVVEILLLDKISPSIYNVLISPANRIKIGSEIIFEKGVCGIVLENSESVKKMEFTVSDKKISLEEIFEEIGTVPLPPYIKRPVEKLDKARYQTVYAKNGSAAAAPTAGLHFTEDTLKQIENLGAKIGYVRLDVSFGTFSPIKVEDFTKHKMHSESFNLSKETAELINNAKSNGKKIIAIGTTSLRVIESSAVSDGVVEEKCGETDLFIYPPYKFKVADMLLTNFHFPRSTLLLLVSAFAGYNLIMDSYKYAIENKFRLFSYGDAMLIV